MRKANKMRRGAEVRFVRSIRSNPIEIPTVIVKNGTIMETRLA